MKPIHDNPPHRELSLEDSPEIKIRPNSIKRCLANLIEVAVEQFKGSPTIIIVSGSLYTAFISHLYLLSSVSSVSSVHIESKGVECGIGVVDVIYSSFHLIFKLYLYPS